MSMNDEPLSLDCASQTFHAGSVRIHAARETPWRREPVQGVRAGSGCAAPRPRSRQVPAQRRNSSPGSQVAAAVFALLLSVPGPAWAAAPTPWRGGPAPALALKDLDGREFSLERFRGRTVIINFWATWCAPCVQELPALLRLRERYRAQGLAVVGVNIQENAARIRPFLEQLGLTFPVLRDHDGSARTAWGVTVFPTTFVIGPDGKVAFVVVGDADWTVAPIESRIRKLVSP